MAESLTGGLIGATLTSVPGSSAVFLGGVTSYANRLKTDLLGIPADTLRQHTVVSEEVAIGMANGLQLKTHADWVIAVTGVAGPDAQEGHAPGEVWICVVGPRTPSVPHTNHVRQFQFDGDRDAVGRRRSTRRSTCCSGWFRPCRFDFYGRGGVEMTVVLLREAMGRPCAKCALRRSDAARRSASARVSLGYLSEVERGHKEASSELLNAICGALGSTWPTCCT